MNNKILNFIKSDIFVLSVCQELITKEIRKDFFFRFLYILAVLSAQINYVAVKFVIINYIIL